MEELQPSPILKFNKNQLIEVRKEFGYEDINKMKQAIEHLEDWIKKQNHFVVRDFGREYLERYIIVNKGSVERAKKRLDRLCTMRNLMPEFLMNFDVKNEFAPLLYCSYNCVLPKPTPSNYRVMISSVYDGDRHDNFDLILCYRYLFVFYEYMLQHDYCAGYEYIVDARNYTFGLIAKLNPMIIQKGLTLLVEAFGLRLKAIHLISSSKFLDAIITILKQGMTEKLVKRIQIHSDPETLQKFIPKEILPVDYGGEEKSVDELSEENFKHLSSDDHIERLKQMQQAVTDERCRLSSKFNDEYSGMPGSFKTLCVD